MGSPLANRVAVVTGASRGIGASAARLRAQEGAKVVVKGLGVAHRPRSSSRTSRRKPGIVGFACSCANALARYGVTANVIAPAAATRMTRMIESTFKPAVDNRISPFMRQGQG